MLGIWLYILTILKSLVVQGELHSRVFSMGAREEREQDYDRAKHSGGANSSSASLKPQCRCEYNQIARIKTLLRHFLCLYGALKCLNRRYCYSQRESVWWYYLKDDGGRMWRSWRGALEVHASTLLLCGVQTMQLFTSVMEKRNSTDA